MQAEGKTQTFRCPYHGWTYNLDGALVVTPEFAGVRNFDRSTNGLVPVRSMLWEGLVFVKLSPEGPSLEDFLGRGINQQMRQLSLEKLRWMERRTYLLNCNWKVFVDNYLDGGYHVPNIHRGLTAFSTLPSTRSKPGTAFVSSRARSRREKPTNKPLQSAGAIELSTTGSTLT